MEEPDEVYKYHWQRTKEMWERIEKQLREREQKEEAER